jgi:hypothetical protein
MADIDFSALTEVKYNGTDLTEVIYVAGGTSTSVWSAAPAGTTYSWSGNVPGFGNTNSPYFAGSPYVVTGIHANGIFAGTELFWVNTTGKAYKRSGVNTNVNALSFVAASEVWYYYPWSYWVATSTGHITTTDTTWVEVEDSDLIANIGQGFGDYDYTTSLPIILTKD